MSTAKQINPSYKPLPALPIGAISTISTISISNSGTSDLKLDSISIGHIRKLLQQSLYNCSVNPDPWESVILGIIFDVSDTVPKAVEALYQSELTKNEFISSQKKINEKNDDKKKDKKDDKDVIEPVSDNQEKFKDESKFVIKLKKEEGGRIVDSHFVHNYFDGEDLFKYEDDEGNLF
jgi:hypothetical protein